MSVKFCDHYGKDAKKYWIFKEKTGLLKNGHLKMSKIENHNDYTKNFFAILVVLLGETIIVGC